MTITQQSKYELLKDDKMGGYIVLNKFTGDFCHYGITVVIPVPQVEGSARNLFPAAAVVKDFSTSGYVVNYENETTQIETNPYGQHP